MRNPHSLRLKHSPGPRHVAKGGLAALEAIAVWTRQHETPTLSKQANVVVTPPFSNVEHRLSHTIKRYLLGFRVAVAAEHDFLIQVSCIGALHNMSLVFLLSRRAITMRTKCAE